MSQKQASILIIDDDEVVLATTEALLQAMGHEVFTHAGAFGASSAIIRAEADLVLLDVNMPGLSGPALVDLIRNKEWAPGARIFFYSSSDPEDLEAAVKESGADGYVVKGDRAGFEKAIERALAWRPPA